MNVIHTADHSDSFWLPNARGAPSTSGAKANLDRQCRKYADRYLFCRLGDRLPIPVPRMGH
jgi:hypothetical protein